MRRLAWLLLFVPISLFASDTTPVQISLRSQAICSGDTITIGDVAEISGGSPLLRDRIRRLDVGEAPKSKESVKVTAAQIEFRLQLTDLPKRSFQVFGVKEIIVVPFVETLSEERIIELARQRIIKSYSWPEEDIQVRLVRPLAVQLPKVSGNEKVVIRVEPHAPIYEFGRCQIDVTVLLDGEKRMQFPLHFETKLLKEIPVAAVSITRGDKLTEASIKFEKRPIDEKTKTSDSKTELIGRMAKRNVAVGQALQLIDFEGEATEPEGAVVIKPKQIVKMVVPLGNVNVVARGEAMQAGKIGQAIRVQNVDSKKVVVGRVTGPDTVEVNPGGVP
jgi:flagella basal body P-ring formation protein FlgA